MNEEKKAVKTSYDSLLVGWIVLGVVMVTTLLGVMVGVMIVKADEGPDAGDAALVGILFAVMIVILLVYAGIWGAAEKKMAHTFLYWKKKKYA